MKYLNLILFSCLLLSLLVVSYFADSAFFRSEPGKPWQLQPFVHEDSLCQQYKDLYRLTGTEPMVPDEADSSKPLVIILVDAWGVPLDDSLLKEDFSIFESINPQFILHQRNFNYNTHAELTELTLVPQKNTFFFGGDSLEYGGREYIDNMGFEKKVFCNKCGDSTILKLLDSAMSVRDSLPVYGTFAWTTQTSREGSHEKLHKTLRDIAAIASRHTDVRFIVQGTHRPILGSPETRRKYHAHWVPVVILN